MDRWAINELKRPSFFLVSLWLSPSDALPPASPSPLHHPSYPSHNPHSGERVFSLVLFSSPSNFSSLFFSSTHVHFFHPPRLSHFSRPFHSFRRSPPRSDLSISISHSLPLPSAFSSPLSSSSTYLLHLLRLSSFSFLVQLAIPRSGETDWKLSSSHALPSCVPPSPFLRPI